MNKSTSDSVSRDYPVPPDQVDTSGADKLFPSPNREAIRTDPQNSTNFAKKAAQFVQGNASAQKIDAQAQPDRIRRMIPRGLFGRSLLIMIIPLLLAQLLVGLLFIERHVNAVARSLARSYAANISILVEKWVEENPAAINPSADPVAKSNVSISPQLRVWSSRMGFTTTLLPPTTPLEEPDTSVLYGVLRESAPKALAAVLDYPSGFSIFADILRIETRVRIGDHIIAFHSHRNNAFADNYHIFLNWMLFATLVVQLLTAYFLRRQIDPIRRLARAAEAWGRGDEAVNLKVEGAREVKQAATAFLTMRARLDRYVRQRTSMLAGVSHDLRTMLTRIKLGLSELTPTEEIQEIESDVTQMTRVVQDYLDFAQGITEEARVSINVETYTRDLVDRVPTSGKNVSISCSGPREIKTREVTLSRCLLNLVTNAVKHSSVRIRISVYAHSGQGCPVGTLSRAGLLAIKVEDDGPGIPATDHKRVFEPFVRLNSGRNLNTPGTGLGLAIARDCALVLGGDIDLSSSELGGLCATVYLPI